MGASQGTATERSHQPGRSGHRGDERGERRLRLVVPPGREEKSSAQDVCECDEAGTTTAEYTVVTGAAVAFGALLFKLLTSEWGNKILSTAFTHVISLLGF